MSGDLEDEERNEECEETGGDEQDELEKLNEKNQQLKDQMEEYFDDGHGEPQKVPPMLKTPPQPTREEFERHQTTHTPYAPWCKHCLAARATRTQQPPTGRKIIVIPDVDARIGPIKVSMDYMYLHERKSKYREATYNPPHMIMIEHSRGRCWAYRIRNKGVLDETHWLPDKMVQDKDNIGIRHHKIQLKADQELAIVNVQRTTQEIKPNLIPMNTPAGEPECHGRVENTIRRIQERDQGTEAPNKTRDKRESA